MSISKFIWVVANPLQQPFSLENGFEYERYILKMEKDIGQSGIVSACGRYGLL